MTQHSASCLREDQLAVSTHTTPHCPVLCHWLNTMKRSREESESAFAGAAAAAAAATSTSSAAAASAAGPPRDGIPFAPFTGPWYDGLSAFGPTSWGLRAADAPHEESTRYFWKIVAVVHLKGQRFAPAGPSAASSAPPRHLTALFLVDRALGRGLTDAHYQAALNVAAAFQARRGSFILAEDGTMDPEGELVALRRALATAMELPWASTDGSGSSITHGHVTLGLPPATPLHGLLTCAGGRLSAWEEERVAQGGRGWLLPLSDITVEAQRAALYENEKLVEALRSIPGDNNRAATRIGNLRIPVTAKMAAEKGRLTRRFPGIGPRTELLVRDAFLLMRTNPVVMSRQWGPLRLDAYAVEVITIDEDDDEDDEDEVEAAGSDGGNAATRDGGYDSDGTDSSGIEIVEDESAAAAAAAAAAASPPDGAQSAAAAAAAPDL